MNTLFYKITTEHKLVLSSYIIDELMKVTRRKFQNKVEVVDILLSQLPYELVYTPANPKPKLLKSVMKRTTPFFTQQLPMPWMFLSQGTEIFKTLDIERPEILTPSDFLVKY